MFEKKKKTNPKIAAVIPIQDIVDDHFLLRNGQHMDIYKITTFDLDSISDSDRQYMLALWARFYQGYSADIKILSLNFSTNTTAQQDYFKYMIRKTHNPIYKSFLSEKLLTLQDVAKNRLDRYYYMMTFSDSKDAYQDNYFVLESRLIRNALVQKIDMAEKLSVLAKIGDKNRAGQITDDFLCTNPDNKLKQAALTKAKKYNPYLLADIQPAGGITFNVERYLRTGGGYESCITIYKYPPMLGLYWLIPIAGINNSVVSIDINTQDPTETKRNINESIRENSRRMSSEKDLTDMDTAAQRVEELRQIYQEIERQGQVIKLITIRIYLFARTYQEIDKITGSTIERIQSNSYKAAVYVNESKSDWTSLYQSYTEQQKTIYSRHGQPILANTLAKGLPYYFTNIDDPTGSLIGTTNSNQGSAILDLFTKTSSRLHYNMLLIGGMGSGKSSTLKKLLADTAVRSNYVRVIDPTGEYNTLVSALGGHSIALDGSSGILNALEILKTSDEGESLCWVNHMSKLDACYRLIAPTASVEECNEFGQQMANFYMYFGLINSDEDLNNQRLTGLAPEAYPTWSDFYKYLRDVLDHMETPDDAIKRERSLLQVKRIDAIISSIGNLITNFGYLVDGHTSVANVLEAPIISFNSSGLTKIKPEICDMQLFLALQLCWDNCVQVGGRMKELFDTNQINWNDITRSAIIIDESHRFINAQKLSLLDQVAMMFREARKYFGGLWLASQNIRDFVPQNSSQEGTDKVQVLFELCQYKFLLRQDANAQTILENVFRNTLSASDIKQIPTLDVGQAILCLGSERKVQINIELTAREKDLLSGGA